MGILLAYPLSEEVLGNKPIVRAIDLFESPLGLLFPDRSGVLSAKVCPIASVHDIRRLPTDRIDVLGNGSEAIPAGIVIRHSILSLPPPRSDQVAPEGSTTHI